MFLYLNVAHTYQTGLHKHPQTQLKKPVVRDSENDIRRVRRSISPCVKICAITASCSITEICFTSHNTSMQVVSVGLKFVFGYQSTKCLNFSLLLLL
jgi:hypothetical protein